MVDNPNAMIVKTEDWSAALEEWAEQQPTPKLGGGRPAKIQRFYKGHAAHQPVYLVQNGRVFKGTLTVVSAWNFQQVDAPDEREEMMAGLWIEGTGSIYVEGPLFSRACEVTNHLNTQTP